MKKFAIHHCNTINIDTKSKEDNISNQNMEKKAGKDKNNTGMKRKIQLSRPKMEQATTNGTINHNIT